MAITCKNNIITVKKISHLKTSSADIGSPFHDITIDLTVQRYAVLVAYYFKIEPTRHFTLEKALKQFKALYLKGYAPTMLDCEGHNITKDIIKAIDSEKI